MTSYFILYLTDKPKLNSKIILPAYNEYLLRYDFYFYATKYNYIQFCGWGNHQAKSIAVIHYFGWNKADKCFKLQNEFGSSFWERLGVFKDGWFLTIRSHDTIFDELYFAMWIAVLENQTFMLFHNTKDITEIVSENLKTLENFNEKTNPLINPDAIFVIKLLSNKRRYIALEKKPERDGDFRRI